jgi:peroxiredoxin
MRESVVPVSLLLVSLALLTFIHARAMSTSAAAPRVGQRALDFTLTDSSRQRVSFDQFFAPAADDPQATAPEAVLLIFYRGYWRPHCNLELRGVEKRLTEFKAAGARPVAISVDPPEVSRDLCKKAGYRFIVLSDPKAAQALLSY